MSIKYNHRIYSIKTITGGLFALALSIGIIYGAYILYNEFIMPIIPSLKSGIKYLIENINVNNSNGNLSINFTNKTNFTNQTTNQTNFTNHTI